MQDTTNYTVHRIEKEVCLLRHHRGALTNSNLSVVDGWLDGWVECIEYYYA